MTFSEALDIYLDARDRLAVLNEENGDWARSERHEAAAEMREAATAMNLLAPGRVVDGEVLR